MKNVINILFIILVSLPQLLQAQKYHTNSQRALNYYNAGKQQYDFLYYSSAEQSLKEAIRLDKNFFEAYALLGDMLFTQKRYSESAFYYQGAVKIDSLFYKPLFFELAMAEMKSGQYSGALNHFVAFLELNPLKPENEKNRAAAEKAISNCRFAIEAMKNPVPFNPVSLGDSVNTIHDEYWPSITVDGQTLLFTRQERSKGKTNIRNQEDFYISRLYEKGWGRAFNAGAPLNTPQNEGAQSVTSDGAGMYFTACERPQGMGRCDIYYSSYDGKRWLQGINPGAPLNTKYWEAQPSISSNGKMLFFASNRPGGAGGMDLWYAVMNSEGKWNNPVNLGNTINTPGDEMSPFIHFDGKTLYFSSNGHNGMGGHDIFFSKMNPDTTWTDPVNLGYPINTYNDEMGLIIDASGTKAYYSSVRDDKNGKDIFTFDLYAEARPEPVSYFRGKVMDKETGKLLKAEYELVNLKTGTVVAGGMSGSDGNFLVCLTSGSNYGFSVSKTGYLFYSDNFMLEGIHSAAEPYIKRVLLTPLRKGETLLLSNVFFEFDSWELKPESLSELNRLFRLLSDNPDVSVEIGGFTDSIGTETYNLTLSERRARSVVNYLLNKGIVSERLSYKGYGASQPVAENVTAEGRKLNRRTEVRVTGDGKK